MNIVVKNMNKLKNVSMVRNGKTIGSINYYTNKESTYLINLYVNKEFRRKNIGSKLINKVEEINKDSLNFKLCVWESTHKPGLIDFYKKNGFILDEQQKPYYYDDGVSVNYLTNMYKKNGFILDEQQKPYYYDDGVSVNYLTNMYKIND